MGREAESLKRKLKLTNTNSLFRLQCYANWSFTKNGHAIYSPGVCCFVVIIPCSGLFFNFFKV